MNKKELLIEAKKRYPIGTVFKPAHVKDEAVTYTIENHDKLVSDSMFLWNYGIKEIKSYEPVLYDVLDDKWAEIVSKPEEETKPLKLEDLKEGVVITNGRKTTEVQSILGKIIICLSGKSVGLWSIDGLIDDGYTIKQPEPVVPEKKYYLGFEVRSYEGENIIVKASDTSIDEAKDGDNIYFLSKVFENSFYCEGVTWKYAVLATCNNHLITLNHDK